MELLWSSSIQVGNKVPVSPKLLLCSWAMGAWHLRWANINPRDAQSMGKSLQRQRHTAFRAQSYSQRNESHVLTENEYRQHTKAQFNCRGQCDNVLVEGREGEWIMDGCAQKCRGEGMNWLVYPPYFGPVQRVQNSTISFQQPKKVYTIHSYNATSLNQYHNWFGGTAILPAFRWRWPKLIPQSATKYRTS